jgi:hypothetical protein
MAMIIADPSQEKGISIAALACIADASRQIVVALHAEPLSRRWATIRTSWCKRLTISTPTRQAPAMIVPRTSILFECQGSAFLDYDQAVVIAKTAPDPL